MHGPPFVDEAPKESLSVRRNLSDLLTELRIFLPGTQVLLAFLMTMPLYPSFRELSATEHVIYLCTFFATLLALALFVAPAAYHRITRPIHHRVRFKALATRMLIAGLVPTTIALVLITYLVTSLVAEAVAIYAATAIAFVLFMLWWVVPLTRLHDRYPKHVED